MIEREELERWTRLYDLGYLNFDGISAEAINAKTELNRQLEEAHKKLIPAGSVSFREFKREAIRMMKALLSDT
jgi:hypothetical protein